MESANGTIKTERASPQRYATRTAAKADLIEYIGYDHTERRHSALGYHSPAECERQWQSQQHSAQASPSAKQGDT